MSWLRLVSLCCLTAADARQSGQRLMRKDTGDRNVPPRDDPQGIVHDESQQGMSDNAYVVVNSEGDTIPFDDSPGHVHDESREELPDHVDASIDSDIDLTEHYPDNASLDSEEDGDELGALDEAGGGSDSRDQGRIFCRRRSCRRRRRRLICRRRTCNPVRIIETITCSNYLECLEKAIDDSDAFKWVPSCGSSSCESKVPQIAANAFSKTFGFFKTVVKNVIDDFPTTMGATGWMGAKSCHNEATNVFHQIKTEFNSVVDTIKTYTKSFPTYRKYSLGTLRAEKAFWYMQPTDCGAFSSLAKIFSHKAFANDHFKDARTKFKRCIGLKGVLNVPTPFMNLVIQSYTMPQFLVTPFEYLLGAVIYGGDAAQDIVKKLETLTDILDDKLRDMNLGSMLEGGTPIVSIEGPDGKVIPLEDPDEGSSELETGHEGDISGKWRRPGSDSRDSDRRRTDPLYSSCGPQRDWSFEFGGVAGFRYEPGQHVHPMPKSMGFNVKFTVVVGCKDNQVLPVNVVLRFSASSSIMGSGFKGFGTAGTLQKCLKGFVGFGASYPDFTMGNGRVAFDPSLELLPSFEYQDIKLTGPTNLIMTNGFERWKAVNVEFGGCWEPSFLEEGGAKDHYDAEPVDPRLGPLGTAIASLVEASSDQGFIDSAASEASRAFSQRHSLMERATTAVTMNQSDNDGPDFDIRAAATFSFCLTAPKCHGA